METYEIRPFTANNWLDLKKIRLEALNNHPTFFSPSQDETKFTENDWKMKILNPRGCIFGLYFQVKIIGLTGIVIDKENAEVAHLVMSYIKDNFRGLNLSAFLYESRIEWAKRQSGIKTLTLDINEDNLPSQLACQKHGFKIVHSYIDEGQKVLTYHLDL